MLRTGTTPSWQVAAHVKDAISRGATASVGGMVAELGGSCRGGHFFEPTVLTDATPDMLCYREETFGPIAPLFRFGGEEEAVRLANGTQ